ncbi:MAG: glycosyl hydrolase 108 family protein [Brevinematia bacterium]
MDKRFTRFFEDILKHEGGYVNHPADKGGETKYGISKRAYPNLDIKNLTKEQAMEIYYRDYWIKSNANEIAEYSFQIATKYCDIAINMGISTARMLLRNALKTVGIDTSDIISGVKQAVEQGKKDVLLMALKQEQIQRYYSIVSRNPTQEVFLKGWLRRASYEGVKEWG